MSARPLGRVPGGGRRVAWWAAAVCGVAVGCAARGADPAPPPAPATPEPSAVRVVRDPELEVRAARLELVLWEREAQLEQVRRQLDEARLEVVRAMAKLQTVASRAEAASAIAEAEVAVQSLAGGPGPGAEVAQARDLLRQAAAEYDRENYGGALYLANQAKAVVRAGEGRRVGVPPTSAHPSEVWFAVPLELETRVRANVREGPGLDRQVAFTLEQGSAVVAHGYVGDWVRVRAADGRSGWVHVTLVRRRRTPTSP